MQKILSAILMAMIIFISKITPAQAFDERIVKMNIVLEAYHSPMAGFEKELIQIAEENNLDWTLLAAIAGTESSFGKRMPYKCINPYGWGIYGKNKLCFESFIQSAQAVATGLSQKYNTTSLQSIAQTYNTVSTNNWLKHTQFFMRKIKNTAVPVSQLPITL